LGRRKSERGRERGRRPFSRLNGIKEAPERREISGEQKSLTRTKPSGSERRERLFWGERKATEAAEESRKVFLGTARVERGVRKDPPTPEEEESSEERSPRALGAERGFQGKGS